MLLSHVKCTFRFISHKGKQVLRPNNLETALKTVRIASVRHYSSEKVSNQELFQLLKYVPHKEKKEAELNINKKPTDNCTGFEDFKQQLNTFAQENDFDALQETFSKFKQLLPSSTTEPTSSSSSPLFSDSQVLELFNIVIRFHCANRDVAQAATTLEELVALSSTTDNTKKLEPNAHTFSCFVFLCEQLRKLDEAEFYLAKAKSIIGSKASLYPVYKALIEGLLRSKKVEKAKKFLNELSQREEPPVEIYNAFVRYYMDTGNFNQATNMLQIMDDYFVAPALSTFEILLQASLRSQEHVSSASITSQLERVEYILAMMQNYNIHVTESTMTLLLDGYSRLVHPTELVLKFHEWIFQFDIRPTHISIEKLISILLQQQDVETAFQVFTDFWKRGAYPERLFEMMQAALRGDPSNHKLLLKLQMMRHT